MGVVKLSSPMRYAGGKSKLITPIIQQLDQYLKNADTYFEPFVGGGSVFLYVVSNYPNIKNYYINDKNYGVACFWSIITGGNDDAINQLYTLIDNKPTPELHAKLRKDKSTDPVICAYKALFFNRCNFSGIESSGMIGGSEQKSKYKIDCRYNSVKLKQKISAIHKATEYNVVVSNVDINDYNIFWETDHPAYIDPPYVKAGKELYVHYFENEQHKQLACNLQNRNNWVLSYDDCDLIKNLYSDNEIIDLKTRYSIKGAKTTWVPKNELLIKKYDV